MNKDRLIHCIIKANRGWKPPKGAFKFGVDMEYDYYVSFMPYDVTRSINHHANFIKKIKTISKRSDFKFSSAQQDFHQKLEFPKEKK